ncbi:MAG: hypothetical protein U5N86_01615 [Planctomycetota bacterium]|nr:hypothetical protein [Planctomycetota bacterium]
MKASELFKNLDKLIPNKLAILVTLVALFVALFPVVIVLAKEFSLSSDDKQRKLYFHSSLCAARVQDNLRQYETFLKTVVLDPQVKDLVTGNLPDSKRASQVLAGTSRHMKAVFPSSLAFLATYESMPYFVPTPPNEFSLGTESQVLAFLAESMPNSFSGQVAFRWSKPFHGTAILPVSRQSLTIRQRARCLRVSAW